MNGKDGLVIRIGDYIEKLYGSAGAQILDNILNLAESWREKSKGFAEKNWVDEKDVMLITYGDSIKNENEMPLVTLTEFLNKHMKETITAVHVLPMYPYTSDDGFSITDYYEVDSSLGSWEDINRLAENFDIMLDGVINHVSKSSKWFKGFLDGDEEYRDYFITADPEGDYSSVTRPRALPLLTAFSTRDGVRHVWTTFSDDQIDLNYKNPKVLLEILNVLLFYAYNGARFIRLDAIGFAWKEMGTACINLENTHMLVKLIRAVLQAVFPGTILITETNVPHSDNISYFGDGTDEAQLVYQFPLPPLTLFSILTANAEKLGRWAESLEKTPLTGNTAYFNFLASHDGIGMRPVEGILTESEKDVIYQTVIKHGGRISYKFDSDGSKSPYELNINYMDALTDPTSPDMGTRVDRFVAAHAIMLSIAGMPGIYIHSLVGSQSWNEGLEQSRINRRINREKLDAEKVSRELENENSIRNRVFNRFKKLTGIRRQHSAFSPMAEQKVVFLDKRVFSLIRHNHETGEKILAIINVSPDELNLECSCKGFDIISNEAVESNGIRMLPYQCRWIRLDAGN